jgi:DNA-binding NarL/FixJ family response regulator
MKELLAKIEAQLERNRRIHAEIVRMIQQLANTNSEKDSVFSEGLSAEVVLEKNPKARSKTSSEEEPSPLPLTPAEERVFWEVIRGLTNKQISEHLFISPRTVQTHLSNILAKLNLENRTQLVRFAYEQGYDRIKH